MLKIKKASYYPLPHTCLYSKYHNAKLYQKDNKAKSRELTISNKKVKKKKKNTQKELYNNNILSLSMELV